METKFKVGDLVTVKSMDGDYDGDYQNPLDKLKEIGNSGQIVEVFTFEISGHETAYQIKLPNNGIYCNYIDIQEQDLVLTQHIANCIN